MAAFVAGLALIVVGSCLSLAVAIWLAPRVPDDCGEPVWPVQVWQRGRWTPPTREPVEIVLERFRRVGHD